MNYEEAMNFIQNTNKFGSVLGLGNIIYKNYYDEYYKFKNKNIYDIAKFDVKVNNKMYRFGNINKGA